ncbi:hypothetical protein SPHINGOT1_490033 [Sphingomonas sp. T1]|nr:hypothetical protein SPHINGOT1_490033 [Sphingomonas sp. T1]
MAAKVAAAPNRAMKPVVPTLTHLTDFISPLMFEMAVWVPVPTVSILVDSAAIWIISVSILFSSGFTACPTAISICSSTASTAFWAISSSILMLRSARNNVTCMSSSFFFKTNVAVGWRGEGQGPRSGRVSGDGGHDFAQQNGGAPSSLRLAAPAGIMGRLEREFTPAAAAHGGLDARLALHCARRSKGRPAGAVPMRASRMPAR